jgi:3-dehydro-L-gulonate 2-dehydrogenase
MDPSQVNEEDDTEKIADGIVDYVNASEPASANGQVYYPGENSLKTRIQNREQGIPVDDRVWEEVKSLLMNG